MTFNEKSAWKHWSTNYKVDNGNFETEVKKESRKRLLLKNGWLTQDKDVLELLENGIDAFKRQTAERILKEEKIEFNNCPKCGKLTTTPNAQQCRFCRYDWH